MSEPFLILHKVRGQPAFDIAERWEFDGEEGWIVSTSGHRAYPYWNVLLEDIDDTYDLSLELAGKGTGYVTCVPVMPDDWPDHYVCNDRPIREATHTVQRRAASMLEKLGLVKKVAIERRD